MAYEPTTWKSGDLITASRLNKMEQGMDGGWLFVEVTVDIFGNRTLNKTVREILEAFPLVSIVSEEPSNLADVFLMNDRIISIYKENASGSYFIDTHFFKEANNTAYIGNGLDAYPVSESYTEPVE